MSGFLRNDVIKIVVDTNILFMAWHNSSGKAAIVLDKAREGKIILYAPDSVKEEIVRVFKRHGQAEEQIESFLADFPIIWIEKDIYNIFLNKTKVKHNADKPVEALSLALGCSILSADNHFNICKNRVDIDKLLREFG